MMYYRRCASCGSKALATATRCPRCEAAFELNDQHGKRHRLVPCRNCKVVQPSTIEACEWCGTPQRSRVAIRPRTILAFTGVAATVAIAVASRGAIVPVVQSSLSTVTASAAEVFAASTIAAPTPPVPAAPAVAQVKPAMVNAARADTTFVAVDSTSVATLPATTPDADVTDDVWEEAKAITWVNVRSDRSRDASILAVVNPDEVVRLGARASGWRQVNIDGATGWVDARHFAVARQ